MIISFLSQNNAFDRQSDRQAERP